MYSEKEVAFGENWLYSDKVVVFGQSGFVLAKVVVFGQSGCISSKSGGILTKVVDFGQSGIIRNFFWQNCLYSGKVFVSGKKRLYSGKSIQFNSILYLHYSFYR